MPCLARSAHETLTGIEASLHDIRQFWEACASADSLRVVQQSIEVLAATSRKDAEQVLADIALLQKFFFLHYTSGDAYYSENDLERLDDADMEVGGRGADAWATAQTLTKAIVAEIAAIDRAVLEAHLVDIQEATERPDTWSEAKFGERQMALRTIMGTASRLVSSVFGAEPDSDDDDEEYEYEEDIVAPAKRTKQSHDETSESE